MKGSYILVLKLSEDQAIPIGSLKVIHFHCGYYAYVGSALGGLKSRLNRHLRRGKKPHWHIDYLLQRASINNIIVCEAGDRIECTIAQALNRRFDSIAGFGSSDCRCHSHLFFSTGEMVRGIMAMLDSLGMEPILVENLSPEVSYII